MSQVDPVFSAVTAPGTPFEIIERDGLLQFANAAPDLALMIDHARRHATRLSWSISHPTGPSGG